MGHDLRYSWGIASDTVPYVVPTSTVMVLFFLWQASCVFRAVKKFTTLYANCVRRTDDVSQRCNRKRDSWKEDLVRHVCFSHGAATSVFCNSSLTVCAVVTELIQIDTPPVSN